MLQSIKFIHQETAQRTQPGKYTIVMHQQQYICHVSNKRIRAKFLVTLFHPLKDFKRFFNRWCCDHNGIQMKPKYSIFPMEIILARDQRKTHRLKRETKIWYLIKFIDKL